MAIEMDVAEQPAGCLTYIVFVVASLWVIAVMVVGQGIAYVLDQALIIQEVDVTTAVWPAIWWGMAVLAALPIVPLAAWTRAPRFSVAYRTWLLAIGFLAVLSLLRFFPRSWTQEAALGQIIVCLAGARFLSRRLSDQGEDSVAAWDAAAVALVLGALVALPWIVFGALGSVLDTLLNLAAAFSLGILAATLLAGFLLNPLARHSAGPGWDIAFGGFAAGVALLVLGTGFGFDSSHMLLLAALPPLGFVAVAIGRMARQAAWLALAVLIGLAAAGPLLFFDPQELLLLVGMDDVIMWARSAATISLALAVLAGLIAWFLRHQLTRPPGRALALSAVLVACLGLLAVYFLAGRPGFYGDQLFVILRDQADLTQASSIVDRNARLSYVYSTLVRHAETSQADLRLTLDRLRAGYRPYYLVNAIEVDGDLPLRLYLSTRPEVERVLDSPHLRPLPQPAKVNTGDQRAPSGIQWNIAAIGADRVQNELGINGAGIMVGQSDSGVDGDHPALKERYRGRDTGSDYNWLDPWNQTSKPTDFDGHGTHTMGSIVGQGGIGVAPGAEWFGCVNLARNLGNPGVYLNCMQFMLAPYPQHGDPFKDGDPARAAHVTNNSWGCPTLEGCDANSLLPAVRALRAAGIFEAASAGNSGPNCATVKDPIAIYQEVFSVGAFRNGGNIANFSSRGPVDVDGSRRIKPDILAPGVGVLSSFPGNTYKVESGTSMAGPHVAGVVALMWSAQPKLIGDIEQTENILRQTAKPYRGARQGCFAGDVPNDAFGYGEVDAYAAVQAALALK